MTWSQIWISDNHFQGGARLRAAGTFPAPFSAKSCQLLVGDLVQLHSLDSPVDRGAGDAEELRDLAGGVGSGAV